MAVSLRVVQVRARMIAHSLSTQGFKASRGRVEKFIRRNGIESSNKLHEKANAKISEGHRERIEEIESIATQYNCSNLCNLDKSGLLYTLCQNRSYLSRSEYRSGARGSCLKKAKQMLTVSFAQTVVKLVWFSGSNVVKSQVLTWLRLSVYSITRLSELGWV